MTSAPRLYCFCDAVGDLDLHICVTLHPEPGFSHHDGAPARVLCLQNSFVHVLTTSSRDDDATGEANPRQVNSLIYFDEMIALFALK